MTHGNPMEQWEYHRSVGIPQNHGNAMAPWESHRAMGIPQSYANPMEPRKSHWNGSKCCKVPTGLATYFLHDFHGDGETAWDSASNVVQFDVDGAAAATKSCLETSERCMFCVY